jgi:hypothetical protein
MMSQYRTPSDITTLIELAIDDCLQMFQGELTLDDEAQKLLDKLSEWKVNLQPQLMHVFEAPMDASDFKDILRQTIRPVIDSLVDEAKSDGVITDKEQKILDIVIKRLNI